MTCTRDDSTDCTCPRCSAGEDAFWREQGGEVDPDMPPEDFGIELDDLDDVTPLPPAPVAPRAAMSSREHFQQPARRSRAKRRR